MDKEKLKDIIAEELQQGHSLSEIQRLLADNHAEKITFLELRLLASELENIDWSKSDPKPEPKSQDNNDASPTEGPEGAAAPSSGTVVTLSKLHRPGAVASGSVQFASGASADWIINQLGQLSLEKASGEPTADDISDFQIELQRILTQGR